MRPVTAPITDRVYEEARPLAYQDEADGWPLLTFLQGVGSTLAEIETLVSDSDDGPGWSAAVDVDRAPARILGWLAQLAGVVPREDLDEGTYRAWIRDAAGQRRGTPASLIAAAQLHLTGTKNVRLFERDTSPYHLTVITRPWETPESDWKRFVNLVTNPSFEVDTAGWLTTADAWYILNPGATITRVAGGGHSGGFSATVASAVGTDRRGARFPLAGTFLAGVTYRLSIRAKLNSGNGSFFVALGNAGANSAETSPTFTGVLTEYTVAWTPTANSSVATVFIANKSALPFDISIDAALVVGGALPPTYIDGDTPGYRWTGTAHASTSEKVLTTIVRDALLSQKPAGLVLAHSVSDAPTVDEGTRTIDAATATIDSATAVDVT